MRGEPGPSAARTSALVVIYDIRGFTAASRRIPAKALGDFAEAAHRTILGAFADRPPTFLKNLGDGHLLLWESGAEPDPVLAADIVSRIERARGAFAAFVASRRDAGLDVPGRIGFGVAFGEVSRADDWYGVALNRASRLQNLARPEGLALDERVLDAAASRDATLREGLKRMRIRLKGLGRTVAWVRRPFSWARVAMRGAVTAAVFLLPVIYVAAADARVSLPGSEAVRDVLDGRGWTVFRPVRSDADVRAAADRARRALAAGLLAARTPEGAVRGDLGKSEDQSLDVWGSSQAICALLGVPHLRGEDLTRVLPGLAVLFEPRHFVERKGVAYGWVPHPKSPYTEAEPVLWTVAALARALGRPGLLPPDGRERFSAHLREAQRAAAAYRPEEHGGWNMFPDQAKPSQASPYSTGLALLALLETRAAGQPWREGGEARRDEMTRAAARFLSDRFVANASPPGWRGTSDASDPISFGFTFQVYATLLRAESDAGIPLPDAVAAAIQPALARLDRRGPDDLRDSIGRWDTGEFSVEFKNLREDDDERNEAINFLWHPWAVETAQRWLDRAARLGSTGAPVRVVRRALGYLVVDLEEEAVRLALAGYTFVASETLYGLCAVPPP